MHTSSLLTFVVLAAVVLATLATAAVAQTVPTGCPPVHVPFWWWAVLLAVGLATLGVLVYGVRRQRPRSDDDDAAHARALASMRKMVPYSVYTYAVDPAGVLRFCWNDSSLVFPLDWPPGGMKGRKVHDYIPAGPEGDEAREAYRRVIEGREEVSYVREDTDRRGHRAVIEYRHVPLPDGGGLCHAYALTPWAERAERAESEVTRLRKKVQDYQRREEADREVAIQERALGIRASAELNTQTDTQTDVPAP